MSVGRLVGWWVGHAFTFRMWTAITAPAKLITAPAKLITAPAHLISAPAQLISAPAQLISAPAQLLAAPAQPPMTGAAVYIPPCSVSVHQNL